MKNTTKLKAFSATLGIFALVPTLAFALQYLTQNISDRALGMITGGVILSILFYSIYQLVLMRFEYNQKVDEIKEIRRK
jgi:hypothetical protein